MVSFSVLLFFLTAVGLAQETIVNPTTAAAGATPLPSASGYTYVGCWNETTGFPGAGGVRALSGGKESANNTLTISSCLKFCASSQYAGLEYGRECYCGAYLSSLSTKLNDSRCVYACDGNSSEVCGGADALTLYNLTSSAKTGVAPWSLIYSQPAWYGMAALVTLILAATL
ncbi:putative fungistatic metabolite [Teratosphaeria destructans]|uniref:Fungistatic metabolite n=1 Tax=Teratosphaeria destructans TaxID=418781 RepID=A0A9W7W790_9PEZI|nr:putative fungistatic metabolite [Teratosphaeria destructans]